MPKADTIKNSSVQAINRMVMATEDTKLLTEWLREEETGLRRKSALHRIYHRLNILRSRQEHERLDKLASGS